MIPGPDLGRSAGVRGGTMLRTAARPLWIALLCAPAFVAWKLVVLAAPSRTNEWVRTAREDGGAKAA